MPNSSKYKQSKARPFTILIYEHFPYLVVISVYLMVGFSIEYILGRDGMLYLTWRYRVLSFFTIFFLMFFLSIQIIMKLARILAHIIERQTGQIRIKHHTSERFFTIERVGGFIIIYTTTPIFFSVFSNIKQSIPLIHPFVWDRFFMKLDYLLHGGNHPWILLQPFLGYPIITKIIDYFYASWLLFVAAAFIWMGWSTKRRLRAQFFLSFILCWILIGTFLAIFFSSAGPCYYSDVTDGVNPFGRLISYLDTINDNSFLFARIWQRDIWEVYSRDMNLPFGGISAMPSVHVATAALFAFVAWNLNCFFGIVLTIYFIIIQLGSVHLGWHYAVDGYFSAILTYFIWKFANRVLKGLGWGYTDGTGKFQGEFCGPSH